MKIFIYLWAMLVVLTPSGCVANPKELTTDIPITSTSDNTSTVSEENAELSGIKVAVDGGESKSSLTLPTYYSTNQADRGEGFFRENCLSCHASSDFHGSSFKRQWSGRTVRDLYSNIAYSMPEDNPGGLPSQTYTDIIAYILELNGYPPGDVELLPGRNAMRALPLWPDNFKNGAGVK